MSRTNFDRILGGGSRLCFRLGLGSSFQNDLFGAETMVERVGTDPRRGRAVDLFEVSAICAFVLVAVAIAAVLSPLIVLCALCVIALETTRVLFGSANAAIVRSEQK
jgi:hypothetical protein